MTMLRMLALICVTLLLVAGTLSCEYEVIEQEPVELPESVSFSEDILPVMGDCTTCHSGGTAPNLSTDVYNNLMTGSDDDGNPYINTDSPEESVLYTKLADNHYPDLSQQNLALILEWITQGAENN